MNARVARFGKPVVTLMDGIVMGGGVGIGAHASHRIVTDRSSMAMPEVGIGFAPDVGGMWLLAHAPGELGTHVGLTAGRLNGADAIACGLSDSYVPAASLGALRAALATSSADLAVGELAIDPPASTLAASRSWIDRCYSADAVADILDRLDAEGGHGGEDSTEASTAALDIRSKSPTSLTVTLRALREARNLPDLERTLEMEYRISTTFLTVPDFVEGVRAAIIDKDRSPQWLPSTLAEVGDVDRFFAPQPDDLDLPAHQLVAPRPDMKESVQ